MTDYLLVMAMMAIALIAVLVVYVLDTDESSVPEETATDAESNGQCSQGYGGGPQRDERRSDAPDHSG